MSVSGVILDFVTLVPHNRKFSFRETANVLHRSAATKDDFTAYGAASAWDALALYASNILSQPWRKEYRELEVCCLFSVITCGVCHTCRLHVWFGDVEYTNSSKGAQVIRHTSYVILCSIEYRALLE